MSRSLGGVPAAVESLRDGRPVVLVTKAEEVVRIDLLAAGEDVDAGSVNFMTRHGGGLVCVALSAETCRRLGIESMPASGDGTDPICVTVEARDGVTTGISAADRARTIAIVADPLSGPWDLVAPGHVVPLRCAEGGALERPGRSEVGVALVELAGLSPAAVLCEILDADGGLIREDAIRAFCAQRGLSMVTADEVLAHLLSLGDVVRLGVERVVRTAHGELRAVAFRSDDQRGGVALLKGELEDGAVTVSVVGECQSGHLFGGLGCDCRARLDKAVRRLGQEPRGVLVYLAADQTQVPDCSDRPDEHLVAEVLRQLGSDALREEYLYAQA